MQKITKINFLFYIIANLFCTQTIVGNPPKKQPVGAEELLKNSFSLAKMIFESGFRPTFLIALWRGGTPIGIAVEEYFTYKNARIDKHCSVRVSAYNNDQLKKEVSVYNLDYIIRNIKSSDSLLIIDDVVDTGSSITTLLDKIYETCGTNTPQKIRIAAPYYKSNTSIITPDYYLYETSAWIIFPHEIEGLTEQEIKKLKGDVIFDIVND